MTDIKKLKESKSLKELVSNLGYDFFDTVSFVIMVIFAVNPALKCVFRLIVNTESIDFNILWRNYNRYILVLGIILLVLFAVKLKIDGRLKEIITVNKKNPIFIFFGIFCALMVISTIVNGISKRTLLGEGYRAEGLLGYLSYIVYFLMAAFCISEKKKRLWTDIFLISSAAVSVVQLIDTLFLEDVLKMSRGSFIFVHFNHYGIYLMMSLALFAFMFSVEKNRKKQILYALGIPLLTAALTLNDTFGSEISVVVGVIFSCIVFSIARGKDKRNLIALLLMTLTVVTAFFTNETARKYTLANIMQIHYDLDEEDDVLTTTGTRLILWEEGAKCVAEKPILGHGADTTCERIDEVSKGDNSRCHIEYLHFAVCFGIPAAVCYFAALFCVFLRGLKYKKQLSDMALVGLCGAFTYMASAIFTNTMYYTTPFLFICLGMGYHKLKAENSVDSTSEETVE